MNKKILKKNIVMLLIMLFLISFLNQSINAINLIETPKPNYEYDDTDEYNPLDQILKLSNSDDYIDIVVSNAFDDDISVLLNNGYGDFCNRHDYPSKEWPTWVETGDLNFDGLADIVLAYQFEDFISIYFNDGNGAFPSHQDYIVEGPDGIAIGDFDNDGYNDIAAAESNYDQVKIFYNDGTGSFPNTQNFEMGWGTEDLITADFNNDGNLDLASCEFSENICVIYGNGNGGFGTPNSFPTSDWAEKLFAADMNNDGFIDIGVAMKFDEHINILLNNGNGGFSLNEYQAKSWPHGIVLGDFNNDGYNDAAAVMYWDDEVGIWINDGSGSLTAPTYYKISKSPEDITTADFNNDGNLDLASVCSFSDEVCILIGYGNGQFGNRQIYDVGNNPKSIAVANFNPNGGVIPPHADFTYQPTSPEEGEEVDFDASNSIDPDGNIVNYEWDFDNDGDTDSTGKYSSYTWNNAGNYQVSLKVTDNDDNIDIKTKTITVTSGGNSPPEAIFDWSPKPVYINDIVQFDASDSSDSDGVISSYSWDFDDDGEFDDATGINPTYSWNSEGSYAVSLKVVDNEGASNINTEIIQVLDDTSKLPPIADFTINPNPGIEKQPVTFDAGQSYDPDGEIVSYTWNFGDGNSGSGSVLTHTYNEEGTYQVQLTVIDNDDLSDSVTKEVIIDEEFVNNPPELSEASGWNQGVDPKSGIPDTTFNFKVHYYDSDGDNPTTKQLKILKPSGSWQTYTMQGYGSDNDYSFSESFSVTGEYQYYYYFEDGNGGDDRLPYTASWTFTVEQDCANAPIWSNGMSWYYDIDPFDISYGNYVNLTTSIDNFYIEVISTSGNEYTLEFYGELPTGSQSNIEVWIPLDNMNDIELSGHLYGGRTSDQPDKPFIQGTIILDKNTLGLKEINNGHIWARIGWSFILATQIEVLNLKIEPETTYNTIQFPLCVGNQWTIPETDFDVNFDWWVYAGTWITNSSDFTFTQYSQEVECVNIENIEGIKTYHIKNLDDYYGPALEHWYAPSKNASVHSTGYLPIWGPWSSLNFDAVLQGCPPERPEQPSGETEPKIGTTYQYTTRSNDPNNDLIQYGWDWNGDKTVDEWTSFYESGDLCSVSHTWNSEEFKDDFINIHVRAKDNNGEISPWSNPLTITKERRVQSYSYLITILRQIISKLQNLPFFFNQ